MIKKNWVYFLFGFSVLVFIVAEVRSKEKEAKPHLHIEARAIAVGSGWGYQIFINDSLYITQLNIPSVAGRKVFTTKEQALLVGNFVVKKLTAHYGLPRVTPKEIDSLGIK